MFLVLKQTLISTGLMVNICYHLILMEVYKNTWSKLSPFMIRHKSVFAFCCEDFVKKIILSSLFVFGTNLKSCPALFPPQVQQWLQALPWEKPSLAHLWQASLTKKEPARRNSSAIWLLLLWNGCSVVSCSFSNTAPTPSCSVLNKVGCKGSL